MKSHQLYEPFDRVWVKMDGYDWWPARIVSDEELQTNGQSRPEGCDITVCFYEGTTTPASLEHFHSAGANLTFFETSSEKAVTADADRLAAIRRAEADEMANPLKYEFALGDRSAANKTGDGVAAAAPGRRAVGATLHHHQRNAGKRSREVDVEEVDRLALHLLPDEKLIDIASRINSALAASDIASLRIELCDLDRVSVTVRQLENTKIGVAVGNILGKKEMSTLWALARAIISSWARALPAETIEAIKRHKQSRGVTECGNDSKTNLRERDTCGLAAAGAHIFLREEVSAPPKAPHLATEVDAGRKRFVDRVRELLENPADQPIPNVTLADLDAIAEELCRDVVELEDRKYLQEQLAKPAMTQLRHDFITRALSGKEFLSLPRYALMTDEERQRDEERITKKIDDQDKLKLANVFLTTLFKCPSCGKNNCSFYEQQIRSADEPTTKFLTCMECKHVWTTE